MDMSTQPRLFVSSVEAVELQMLHEGHHGWSVRLKVRRLEGTWSEEPAEFYGGLSTSEALDVVCAVLEAKLNPGGAGA